MIFFILLFDSRYNLSWVIVFKVIFASVAEYRLYLIFLFALIIDKQLYKNAIS
jgi:hypothetical protein